MNNYYDFIFNNRNHTAGVFYDLWVGGDQDVIECLYKKPYYNVQIKRNCRLCNKTGKSWYLELENMKTNQVYNNTGSDSGTYPDFTYEASLYNVDYRRKPLIPGKYLINFVQCSGTQLSGMQRSQYSRYLYIKKYCKPKLL